jgi:ubiquinone/menaquinone biosynthesis C-methylase UbiE
MSETTMSDPTPIMSAAVYEAFAGLQDWRGLRRQRRRVGEAATGVVLDVGVGTGRNLPYYTRAGSVVGVDPNRRMLGLAERRLAMAPSPVELVPGRGEDLPFPEAQFDTVVVTLTLCSIPDPGVFLAESRRVLKPGGKMVFLEHERSPRPVIAALQDLATPLWCRISGGCHLNRPTTAMMRRAGFELENLWRSRGGTGSLVQGTAY